MAKREEDDVKWFTVKNRTVPYLPPQESIIRNLSMPQNHHFASPASFSSPGNPLGRPENYLFQLSQPEINPYHPNTLPKSSIHVNPSFPETLYGPLFEELNRLNVSTPSHHSQSTLGCGGGVGFGGSIPGNNSPIGMGFLPPISYAPAEYSDEDLQRLRVQFAVMGQTDLYIQPHGFTASGEESLGGIRRHSLNSNSVNDYQYNRCPTPMRTVNQNGFHQSHYEMGYGGSTNSNGNGFRLDTNFHCRSRSSNGFEPDNGSVYNNHLYPSQQHPDLLSLEGLRGKIFMVAKSQHGCRFLQKKFEEGKLEEVEMIFLEIKDHVRELMVDQFGNYLIQKFFEVCNQQQITQMLLLVISDERHLMNICGDMHGTRAMQKLLEHLTNQDQRSLVISALRRITVNMTKSLNGHHVIEHCLKNFSNKDNKHLLKVVADNCLDIATDKSGCCVLQQCVSHAEGEPKEHLVAEIIANALVLSEHPYGNYVVQYILGMRIHRVTADLLAQLVGSYVSLSMNKYGSNVVEKCLRESGEDQASQIIKEIVHSPNFLMVLQDPYGNYVAQSALAISKGTLHTNMVNLIQSHYPFLHSHPHGKRVLARARGGKQRV